MPNTFSKTLDKGQRTIGIYKAQISQGVFSGWGLSSLQQNNPTYNHYENTGSGTQNLFSGSGNTFSNSLNTAYECCFQIIPHHELRHKYHLDSI